MNRVIEIYPKRATAWFHRGVLREAKGDLDGAIADYSRAIDLDPKSVLALLNRGIARQAKGDGDEAIADWQRFLEVAPNHVKAPAVRAALEKMRAHRSGAGK